MAIQTTLHVENAGDLLATAAYGAGAVARLHRDTTAAFAAPTSVSTTALVSGTDRYEVWDADGSATSWYRFRIENSGGTELSDWSVPWQVLTQQPIATLASCKMYLGAGATDTDDDALAGIIAGVNRAIVKRIGYYPGPSSDTTRTYHGRDAVRGGKRLWIPGGIRTLTSLTIAGATGDAGTAATSTDWVLGPHSSTLQPGEPYWYIDFADVTTGNWSYFPNAYGNVVPVGLFGFAQPPEDLVYWGSFQSIQIWKARASGTGMVGATEFGNIDLSRLPSEGKRVIDSYRMPGVV